MASPHEPNWLQWVLEHWQQVLYHPLVASLTGAFGAAFHAFPGASTGAKAVNGVSCFFIGIYAGPAIIEWREVESLRIGAGIIVATSLTGLIAVNAALDYMRNTPLADWPIIRNILKKGDDHE